MADLPTSHPSNTPKSLKELEVTAGDYLSKNPQFTGIVSAAIVIHNQRALLLQRASSDECPNLWEVPGGGAKDDESIIECAIRELEEETGLKASRYDVRDVIGEFEWVEAGSELETSSEKRNWRIFMSLVSVTDSIDGGDLTIRLDQQEHQTYLWVTENEIKDDCCDGVDLEWISPNQKQALLAAFENIRT